MKLKMYFLLLAMGAFTLTMQSCDDDEDGITVPTELANALAEKYPEVKNAKWETKGTYYVADFYKDNYETSAWFTPEGVWQMTETDIPYNALPAAVKSAFESSKYADWHVDDVDKLERKGMETVYVIEVEQGKQEYDLYYTEEGILANEKVDTDDDDNSGNYLPTDLSSNIKKFISDKYPDARIVEIETEKNGMIEVDIVHQNMGKDVLFKADGSWVSTSWDVRVSELPQAAQSAVNAKYPNYRIDDVEYVETPDGDYYLVEVERGEAEVKVKVTAEGVIL